ITNANCAMIRPIKKTRLVNNSSITAAELAAYQATNAVSVAVVGGLELLTL
ncbi:MAG: hypothetical protein Q621_VSBC00101G0001, partial [Veillonella sp. DORA_B_18_19_23]